MKPSIALTAALLLAATLNLHAQGSLTPPAGAPAPVMKTLDQVEARIPLVAGQPGVSINAAGTITISASGSYYLTGNLTISTVGASAILIVDTAFPLTLDLNGYSLICTSVLGGDAITGNPNGSVTVRNGHILGVPRFRVPRSPSMAGIPV